ncbi:MAG: N-formylglutamate amidohydrolase, partial [Methylovirgula sp.]
MSSGPPGGRSQAAKFLAEGQPHEPELDPPFDVLEPSALASPLVFSSPHSGAVYPRRFLAAARLDAMTLRRSEDAYVDQL